MDISPAQAALLRDEQFELVSLLYHSLLEAHALGRHIERARSAGDLALAQFFEEIRDTQIEHAARAKVLLRDRLGGDTEVDPVDETSMESFPASDAPGTY